MRSTDYKPELLSELASDNSILQRKLSPSDGHYPHPEKLMEQTFRWQMNEDEMATDKLADGIRRFAADQVV